MFLTVPYRRRAVNCRYGMCQAGAVTISARVISGSKGHSRSTSGGRRGGRAWDTTMVIRRVCGIVVTIYLALILVVLLRLT